MFDMVLNAPLLQMKVFKFFCHIQGHIEDLVRIYDGALLWTKKTSIIDVWKGPRYALSIGLGLSKGRRF